MKKNCIYGIVLGAALLAVSSCIEDSRDNFMVDDQLSLAYENIVTDVSLYAGSHTISILKSGKGTTAATATIGASESALKTWMEEEESGVAYKTIPESYYSLESNQISFEASDLRSTVALNWDPTRMAGLVDGDEYVIPMSIVDGSLGINDKRRLVILNILKSTVSFASSGSTVLAKEQASENGEVSVKIKVDRAIPKDITVSMKVDNSLVDKYNQEKGTNYDKAPDGYVVLPSSPVTLEAGATDVYSDITLKTSALFGADGAMMNFRTLVVPIRISGVSLDGVIIADKVYYLLVNSPFSGATVTRIWGRYSLESLWTAMFELPSGADRNLALDEKFVYIPYAVGGSVARITAISVDDPDVVKMVNCDGFITNTITTACVRVIDKGDGSTMLIASGAGENEFAFYAWENGIDNPPSVYKLQCTWRRGGDRIEFHGTWANGVIYAHSYQGTFSTRYIVKDGKFVTTDRTLIDVPYTGFGGFYNYPGQDQMVFASSDAAAFMTLTGTTRKAGDGQDIHETASEPFEGGKLTFGYRVFTYRGDKYIAYTTFDKNDDLKEDGVSTYTTMQRARLVIVKDKGGFKASLAGEDKDIVFEAPLQGEEFTHMAIAPPMSSQADCAVRAYSDKVIIAAGAQGLGVSVFKME